MRDLFFLYAPCVENRDSENAIITEQPQDIVRQGKFNDVPFMTGTMLFEELFVAKGKLNAYRN